MHAFDYNYLEGGKIVVRRADEGEEITTLDGVKRTLTNKMLVISDAKKAVAVAGVMGGENSEIIPETKTIVFELSLIHIYMCIRDSILCYKTVSCL